MKRFVPILCLALAACSPDLPNQPPPPSEALPAGDLKADSSRRLGALLAGAADNAIFSNYAADRPVSWGKNFTRRLDFTGVAWDLDRAGTLVSPEHVVMAAHFQRAVGSTLVFHDRRGRRHARRLVAVEALTGVADVAVGRLDQPLPPGVHAYRLLPPGIDPALLTGCPVVVTDQQRRAFVHEIAQPPTNGLSLRFPSSGPAHLRKRLVVGDSGHPSFLLVGGELALVGTHTWGGPGGGPFYSSPAVFRAVNAAMAKLGGGRQLQTVPLAGGR